MTSVDCIVEARWIAPIEPPAVLEHAALVLDGGRIVDCLPAPAARARYLAREQVRLPTHLVTPGLVNASVDLAGSLWRGGAAPVRTPAGVADGAPGAWLDDSIALGLVEQLGAGITTSADLGPVPRQVGARAAALGCRVVVCLAVTGGDGGSLERALDVHDEYRGHPLVGTAFLAEAPGDLDDALLGRLAVLANQVERPVFLGTADFDAGRLGKLGLLSASATLIGAPPAPDAFAASGATLVLGPRASGETAREVLVRGGGLAFGSGRGGGPRDLLTLLRALAGGHEPGLSPSALLRQATLGGARALGLEDAIGSLAAGKRADLVCFDLVRPATMPVVDPLASLIGAAGRDSVAEVYVAGRRVYAGHRPLVLDQDDLLSRIAGYDLVRLAGGAQRARQ